MLLDILPDSPHHQFELDASVSGTTSIMTDQAPNADGSQQPAVPQPASAIELAALPTQRSSLTIDGHDSDLRSPSEQLEHQPCLEADPSHYDSEHVPRRGELPRRPLANFAPSIFSLIVSLLPIYFLVFAALAFKSEASPILPGSQASWLLEAAKYVGALCEE